MVSASPWAWGDDIKSTTDISRFGVSGSGDRFAPAVSGRACVQARRPWAGEPASRVVTWAGASLLMGKLGQPDEIADFVVFLLSDRSGVVTGSVIDWDQNVLGAFG